MTGCRGDDRIAMRNVKAVRQSNQAAARRVCLDGGGAWSARLAEIAQAAEESGVPVTRVTEDRLGELLSIFSLTVSVQRIALEAAETLGVNPDTFGRDRPDRHGWDRIAL